MKEREMEETSLPPDTRSEGFAFDFYRCKDCARIITAIEERQVLARQNPENGDGPVDTTICPCGARRYSPTNLIGRAPADFLNPGAGKAMPRWAAKLRFWFGTLFVDGEWKEPRVLEFAWLRYRGIA